MFLQSAKKLLEEGDEDRARDLILGHRRTPSNDPEVHYQWGLLCEEIGAFNLARESHESALRLDPRNPKYLCRLAHLHSDAGQNEKAMRYARQAVKQDADSNQAKAILAELLDELGHKGSADLLQGVSREEPSPYRYFPPSVGRTDLETFLRLFAGREIGYSTQELISKTGESSWTYHEKVLTGAIVEDHIQGRITLGGLPLRTDHTVKYCAVHIRPHEQVVLKHLKNPSILSELEDLAEQQAQNLVAACAAQGISAYLDDAGDRDRRVWFFFDRYLHFLLLRRFLIGVLNAAALIDSRLAVEPLLPTRPVGIGWQERPILLPFGIDRRTGKRTLFVDAYGKPYPEQLKLLRKIRPVGEPAVRTALRIERVSFSSTRQGDKTTAVLRHLRAKCPVLGEIMAKAGSGRKLAGNERLILFYTLGLSSKTRQGVHAVLNPCPDYEFQKVERILERLKPHPVSCLKIRSIVPDLTASVHCACTFDLKGGKYPAPFLHIEPETSLCVSAEKDLDAPLKELIERYFFILSRERELQQERNRVENAISEKLGRKRLDGIATPHGYLRLIEHDGKPSIMIT